MFSFCRLTDINKHSLLTKILQDVLSVRENRIQFHPLPQTPSPLCQQHIVYHPRFHMINILHMGVYLYYIWLCVWEITIAFNPNSFVFERYSHEMSPNNLYWQHFSPWGVFPGGRIEGAASDLLGIRLFSLTFIFKRIRGILRRRNSGEIFLGVLEELWVWEWGGGDGRGWRLGSWVVYLKVNE